MDSEPIGAPTRFGPALRELRRTRELSQLALAELAATSQRHLSFLEKGRSQPSRAMVLQIAEALQRMLRHHKPYPAIVVNRRWDLVLMNGTVARLFALVGDGEAMWRTVAPDGRRNILRMIFHPSGLRQYIRNFEDVARMLLGYVQREANESADAAEILAELTRDGHVPRRLRGPKPMPQPTLVFATQLEAFGIKLSLFTMISTFGTPQDVTADELRAGSFYPADDASEAFLRSLGAQGAVP